MTEVKVVSRITTVAERRSRLVGGPMETMAPAVLGLDIGGTKLAAAVITADGRTHGMIVEPTRREEGPDAVLARLFAMGHRAVAGSGTNPISAVGISCGGPLDATAGVLLCPPHLPGWHDIGITALAREKFGVDAVLENDATAGARAEHAYGAGRGTDTMLYLTLSTGVGGGAVIDGRVHQGAAGNGGEFGHLLVQRGGRLCSCGRHGCLEAYASGTNIAARAMEALATGTSSMLSALPVVTAADVSAAARSGDPLATSIWRETTDLLSEAITDLVNVIEPELVVLGGGVTHAGAMLLDPVRQFLASMTMGPAARVARIELAGLGDAVCVIGAGARALAGRVSADA